MTQALIGIIAGIVGLVGCLPYIIATITKKISPNRAPWWILAFLGSIQCVSYYHSGAINTIWLPLLYTICQIIIAILSVKFGEGGWHKLDRICLIGAGVSILFWLWHGDPIIALLLTLIVHSFGALPTIIKSYRQPKTESRFSWTMFLLADILNLFALENWSFDLAIYPLYLLCLSLTIATILNLARLRSKILINRLKKR